jgi:hypothetical protein
VAEWFKAPVLKTGDVQASVGSNPTLSANGLSRSSKKISHPGKIHLAFTLQM